MLQEISSHVTWLHIFVAVDYCPRSPNFLWGQTLKQINTRTVMSNIPHLSLFNGLAGIHAKSVLMWLLRSAIETSMRSAHPLQQELWAVQTAQETHSATETFSSFLEVCATPRTQSHDPSPKEDYKEELRCKVWSGWTLWGGSKYVAFLIQQELRKGIKMFRIVFPGSRSDSLKMRWRNSWILWSWRGLYYTIQSCSTWLECLIGWVYINWPTCIQSLTWQNPGVCGILVLPTGWIHCWIQKMGTVFGVTCWKWNSFGIDRA